MRACFIDGVAWAVMVGMGESMFGAFALRLGLGELAAGLIATLPILVAAVVQYFASALVRRVGSYVRFVTACASLHAAMYIPLAALALAGPRLMPWLREHHVAWLGTAGTFLLISMYWAAGNTASPAWTALAGAIIPARLRTNYFARRSRWLQAGTLAGVLGAGVVLATFEHPPASLAARLPPSLDPALAGFACIFLVACACRALSAWYLSRYSEPDQRPHADARLNVPAFLREVRSPRPARALAYVLASSVAVQIAQPFLVPFFNAHLRMDRALMFPGHVWAGSAFAWLIAGAYIGRILALPSVGRLIERFGPRPMLLAGAIGIAPIAVLPLLADQPIPLFLTQVLAGVLWAVYDLSVFLISFNAIPAHQRAAITASFNLCNEACKTAGTALGGVLLNLQGTTPGAYALVFWLSCAARALVLVLLRGGAGSPPTSPPLPQRHEHTRA